MANKESKGGRTVHSTVRLTPEVNELIEKLREGTFNSYSDIITLAVLAYYQRKQKEPKVENNDE